MAKEWILNSVMNRFQLNFKRNVGAVSEAIRQCAPKDVQEWEAFYFTHVRDKAHLEELGRKLYIKIGSGSLVHDVMARSPRRSHRVGMASQSLAMTPSRTGYHYPKLLRSLLPRLMRLRKKIVFSISTMWLFIERLMATRQKSLQFTNN